MLKCKIRLRLIIQNTLIIYIKYKNIKYDNLKYDF